MKYLFYKRNALGISFIFVSIFLYLLPAISQAQQKSPTANKTWGTFYEPIKASELAWAEANLDEGVTDTANQLNTNLFYFTWSSWYLEYQGWGSDYSQELYDNFDAAGADFDDAFIHYSQDVDIPPNTYKSLGWSQSQTIQFGEDRFFRVLNFGGSPTWSSLGPSTTLNSSLLFKADGSYVNLGQAIIPQITQDFTFEAWINPQVQTPNTRPIIVGFTNNTGFPTNGLWIAPNGTLVADININNQNIGAQRYTFPVNNQWYHVAAVGSSSSGYIQLYVNGNLIGGIKNGTTTFPLGGTLTHITGPLEVGSLYQGNVTNVRVYNRALSASEVLSRYSSNTLITSGLVGRWDFDEGQGVKVNDTSGNNLPPGYLMFPDITALAYGDSYNSTLPVPQVNNIPFSTTTNGALYAGEPWGFSEINFNLSTGSGIGWSGAWEYWNGSGWVPLTISNDGTNNMLQSGKVSFDPPSDWKKTNVNGLDLDWIRLRNTSSSNAGPFFQSTLTVVPAWYNFFQGTHGIWGWQYATTQVNGVTNIIIPGWDPANNPSGTGWVNDNEFANLVDPGATARFKSQSMVPSWYFNNEWITNPGNPILQSYLANEAVTLLQAANVNGIFNDNVAFSLSDPFGGAKTYLEYTAPNNQYLPAEITALTGMNTALKKLSPTNLFVGNANSNFMTTPSMAQPFDECYAEDWGIFDNSFEDTPATMSLQANSINTLNQSNKTAILQGTYLPSGWDNPQLIAMPFQTSLDRLGLYDLAKYLEIKAAGTYFSLEQPLDYGDPETYFIPAINFDVGSPNGPFSVYQIVRENYPNPPPANILVDPDFTTESSVPSTPPADNDWFFSKWSGPSVSPIPVNIDSTVSEDGTQSLRIDASPTSVYVGAQYVFQNLQPNTTYTLSGWIKTLNLTSSNSNSPAYLYIYGGPNGVTGTNHAGVPAGTNPWSFVSTTFTTGANLGNSSNLQNAAKVFLVNAGISGTAWFSDIKLELGSYALTYIYARSFQNALVLLKPPPATNPHNSSIGDDTATTVNLNAYYQPLNADGTEGPPTNTVSLDDFTGMILVNTTPDNLSVLTGGSGFGEVFGSGGISCGVNSTPNVCSTTISSGTTVTLTAVAASGSTFSNWTSSPSGVCGTSNTCTFTMSAGTSVTADFTPNGQNQSIINNPPAPVAPSITVQPVNATVTVGQTATFIIVGAGTAPLSYQWDFNGAAIAGATSSSYTIAATAAVNAGNYTVTVSNATGSVISNSATLTVNLVVNQTYTLTVVNGSGGGSYAAGTVVTVTANAAPAGEVFSGWTGAAANPGAAITTLNMPAANTTVTANYTVAQNLGSGINPGTYNVNDPVAQFANISYVPLLNGNTTDLAQGVAAQPAFNYPGANPNNPIGSWVTPDNTWPSSWPSPANILNTTPNDDPLVIYNLKASYFQNGPQPGGYSYFVVAQPDPKTFAYLLDTDASASNTFYLNMAAPQQLGTTVRDSSGTPIMPIINVTSYPTLANGGTPWLEFMVVVTPGMATLYTNFNANGVLPAGQYNIAHTWAGADPSLTWSRFDKLDLDSAYGVDGIGAIYKGNLALVGLGNVPTNQQLQAFFANPFSPITTNNQSSAPSITTQPVSQTVTAGQTATFTVVAASTAPLSYQWYFNGAVIAGATSSTYTIAATAASNAGNYTVTVSNAGGFVTSSTAILTVNPAIVAPSITTQPASQTVTAGQPASFTVAATGTGPLTYQWNFNGVAISGATSASYAIAVTAAADVGSYSVFVSNSGGSVTSNAATLKVNPAPIAPTITTEPINQSVILGQTATFAAAAAGTAPLSYQWQLNGVNIPGATVVSYTTAAVTDSYNQNNYDVVISNLVGKTMSNVVDLTVIDPPIITIQPGNQTVTAGQSATFSVAATGTAPLSYQWQENGVNIAGATSASYTTPATTVANSGNTFAVVASNAAGSVTSNGASLTVNPAPVAPSITSQPANAIVTSPATATFSVTAKGTAPLSYQWQVNGVNVGTNSSTYTTGATTVNNTGSQITVTITNGVGSATSSTATLTVNPAPVAPSITVQPANATVTSPATATFSVTATGTAPLSYQWKKNGSNISGATGSSYTTPATVAGDTGSSFTVVVSNSIGSVTSNAATLTVNTPPSITSQPTNVTVTSPATASFSVTATGTAPLTYQWQENGSNIVGATSASYTTPTTALGNSGSIFTVTVRNAVGTVTSSGASLTVNPAPVAPSITTQPSNATVTSPATATFSVTATGTAPLSYQWQRNGINILGATNASYATAATTASNNGDAYTVVISNSVSSVTSNVATLTVDIPPSITTQPADETVNVGHSAIFNVVGTGTAPLTYQWQENGSNIAGATSASYTTPATTVNNSGSIFTVTVSNGVGTVTSSGANLTVNPAPVVPTITIQPVSATVTSPATATFSVTATGTAPLSYQWKKNGVNITGATSATYTTPATTVANSGSTFTVTVSNGTGSSTSSAATLTVKPAPVAPAITKQPANATVTSPAAASFSVTATGTAPLTYQWRENGIAIPGATSASYITPATLVTDSGTRFTVVVSNAVNSITSNVAVLTVNSPEIITVSAGSGGTISPTGSVSVNYGANQTFTITANLNFKVASVLVDGNPVGALTSYTFSNVTAKHTILATFSLQSNVPGALTIKQQPQSQTVTAPQPSTLSVTVTGGTAPYSYQWSRNGENIKGATGSSYVVTITAVEFTGSKYIVTVVDSKGAIVRSNPATLTIVKSIPGTPSITK